MEKQQSDRSREYKFQQMSYFMTQQYCKLRSRRCMKNSMESGVILGSVLVCAAVIIPLKLDKLYTWYKYIVSASVILGLLIVVVCCIRGYNKYKKFKEIPASGKPLEYTTVVAEIGEEKIFLCSDGHEEVWRMEYDDDVELKDGQEAVIIYVPSTGEMITEKPDILDKIYGISKVQQAKKKSDVKVSDKEEDTGTENTGEENMGKGVIGAAPGALIGAAAVIIIRQLGYPEFIAGLVMGFCTFKGYHLKAKGIGKKGILLCGYFIFTQVFVSMWISYAVEVHRLYHIRGLDCIRASIEFIANGKIPLSGCIIDLVMVYGFAVVGALPVILRHWKRKGDNE